MVPNDAREVRTSRTPLLMLPLNGWLAECITKQRFDCIRERIGKRSEPSCPGGPIQECPIVPIHQICGPLPA
jgi:hypothetical protein